MMIISITLSQPHYLFRNRHHGGATLLFVLIMLLIVSIIGVAAARSTLMQERMASNTNVRNIVFEAAESALAAGEIRVANTPEIWKTIQVKNPGDCYDGICDRNTTTSPIWVTGLAWTDSTKHTKLSVIESGEHGLIKVEPKYVIEDLGQTMASCDPDHIDITQSADCPYTSAQRYFRVVSFAKAYETQVMLQSTYLDPNPTREPVTAAAEWKAKPPECDGKAYNPPGEKCCPPDGKKQREWVNTGACPSYCEVKPGDHKEYDFDKEKCCDPNPTGERQIVDRTTGKCPEYCGNDLIDNNKEVCCQVQGRWSVYPGTNPAEDCPQFCGNDPRGAGQVCCEKGGEQYSYTAASTKDCPQFCDVGGTPVPVNSGQECCRDSTKTKNEVITGKCPVYCDGKVWDKDRQSCCSIPTGSRERLVNGGPENCPKFCGLNEIFPGQECCGSATNANSKIYDSKNQQCCLGSNNATAIIGINEFCCTNENGLLVANPDKNCPIWCGNGNNAIRQYEGEECCTPSTWGTPVKAGKTEQCCRGVAVPKTASGRCPETCNGQSYDPGDQQCCYDYDANGNRRQHSPAPKNSVCQQYCNAPRSPGHNKPLAPGQICCTTDSTASNYGDIGQCEGGSGSASGT